MELVLGSTEEAVDAGAHNSLTPPLILPPLICLFARSPKQRNFMGGVRATFQQQLKDSGLGRVRFLLLPNALATCNN
ncbi:hypothetical protein V6N11_055567 [Hibiscus sabdariffa]|uniref:Uncharacterized protein n=1 Tax=Hibiscus sabdariffa TaxID=183260 RepID=A0ABR2NQY1_9ROSI